MKRKTVNMNESTYSKVKEYCKNNGLLINRWIENVVLEKLKEIQNGSNRK